MASKAFKPAQSAFSRVFMIEGRARPDHDPQYESCMAAGSPTKSFGDSTPIEVPHPTRRGKFMKIGRIRGADERATMSLMNRYGIDIEDELLRLARKGCPVDVMVHFGDCKDPSDYNNGWTKIVALTDVDLTDWSTDNDLGTLGSDGQNEIASTTELSAEDIYEVLQVSPASRGGDVITNEVVDVIMADILNCGECDDESDGCQRIYAVTIAAGGSPSTPADCVLSDDGGSTWRAVDIDSLLAAENGSAIGHVGSYIVVVSNDSASLHYVLKSELDIEGTDEAWTEVSTGFVAGGEPNDIWSFGNLAYVVGDGGYIYKMTDPTSGVTVLDAGVAVSDDLNAVNGISREFAVAVGNAGAIAVTENGGDTWTSLDRFVAVDVNLNTVWVQSERIWFVGTNGGDLYYTVDGGTTWNTKGFPGSGAGEVRDIAFVDDVVGYMAHDTAAPAGRILRTVNGGSSWYVLPEDVGTLPANDRINALATCEFDPNLVVGVGLADDGSDGFILVCED